MSPIIDTPEDDEEPIGPEPLGLAQVEANAAAADVVEAGVEAALAGKEDAEEVPFESLPASGAPFAASWM